jgi:hypothetical protein
MHSFLLHNLVLKAKYLHYSMVMEEIVELLVNHDQNPIFAPLMITKLETPTPFWVIFDTPTHHTFVLAWENLVILDQI